MVLKYGKLKDGFWIESLMSHLLENDNKFITYGVTFLLFHFGITIKW